MIKIYFLQEVSEAPPGRRSGEGRARRRGLLRRRMERLESLHPFHSKEGGDNNGFKPLPLLALRQA
jgi:hypothetical protein